MSKETFAGEPLDPHAAADEIVRLRGEVERLTRERDWHKSLTQSHDLLADNAALKARADAAEAAMFDLLRENKRLAKSRDRWGQRYNKILLQLRAAVMTDTDYIKAVDEACENALVERDAALARAEAAEAKVAELAKEVAEWRSRPDALRADKAEAKVAKLREALKDVLLDVDFMVERDVIPDIRSDILYERARTALQETE